MGNNLGTEYSFLSFLLSLSWMMRLKARGMVFTVLSSLFLRWVLNYYHEALGSLCSISNMMVVMVGMVMMEMKLILQG